MDRRGGWIWRKWGEDKGSVGEKRREAGDGSRAEMSHGGERTREKKEEEREREREREIGRAHV